ncbi:hypothetical protein ACGF1Z_35540 [Streptomyces sp. NPDC048018]|uniref:hypothetical protein n=1 Tax=Streptomyces sp. NPDC048018 TaxID=3365499 RepID=UPI00371D4513
MRHHDRWITVVAASGAPEQRAVGVQRLLDTILIEQQRRTALDPKQQRAEDIARSHIQALAAAQTNQTIAHREGPHISGPQQACPSLGGL